MKLVESTFFSKKLSPNKLGETLKCHNCGNTFETKKSYPDEYYEYMVKHIFPYLYERNYVCFDCYESLSDREVDKFSLAVDLYYNGVNSDMSFCNFDNFNATDKKSKLLLEEVIKWYRSDGKFLIILSEGKDKTHLAISCFAEYYFNNYDDDYNDDDNYKKFIFVNERDIFNKMENCRNTRYSTEAVKAELINADWLIIDDLFSSNMSESDIDVILDIIEGRRSKEGRMILNSSLTLEEIEGIDSRIFNKFSNLFKVIQA
jgi:DNA replication protein DnaC